MEESDNDTSAVSYSEGFISEEEEEIEEEEEDVQDSEVDLKIYEKAYI